MNGTKLTEYANEWISSMQPYYKKKTLDKYRAIILNEISPFFKAKRINEKNINLFIHSLNKSGSGLNASITVLESIINYIEVQGYEQFHFPESLFKKSSRTNTIIILNDKQADLLTEYCKSNLTGSSIAILLALYCGLKIGEISALRYCDIVNNQIHIHYQTYRVSKDESYGNKTELILDELSKPVQRVVIIPDAILEYIDSYIQKCQDPNYFLLTNRAEISDGRYAANVLQEFGYTHDFKVNFNILRETFKHYILIRGINVNVAANLLGVSKIIWSEIEECSEEELSKEVNRIYLEW